jgi:aminoglycoside 6'-N-acetyltransferase
MPDLVFRAMREADLELVEGWLREPHVAKWYLAGSTLRDQLDELRESVVGKQPTHVLLVLEGQHPIGWCQWYRCRDYPDHAAAVGAAPEDIGVDYAIGDAARVGTGVGTALIAELVASLWKEHPRAGLIADPEADNLASRRVLEKNGFQLVREARLATEPTDTVMAIYRLAPRGRAPTA